MVQRLAGSTYWLRDMFAPQLQSTGTRTCQCVRTNTVECANAGNNATKVGSKVGSRTLEPSWLHAIAGCLAQQWWRARWQRMLHITFYLLLPGLDCHACVHMLLAPQAHEHKRHM